MNQTVRTTEGTAYPTVRMRRLRRAPALREMVRETSLTPSDLILPLFVRPGSGEKRPIGSMPGQFQYSLDRLAAPVDRVVEAKVPAVLLFGIP